VLALIAMPALAGHCPVDVKAIDAALAAGTDLDEAEVAEVMEQRNEGEQLHNDGKHGESLEVLHKAMDTLELEHAS
jgi:hypothetical protein